MPTSTEKEQESLREARRKCENLGRKVRQLQRRLNVLPRLPRRKNNGYTSKREGPRQGYQEQQDGQNQEGQLRAERRKDWRKRIGPPEKLLRQISGSDEEIPESRKEPK